MAAPRSIYRNRRPKNRQNPMNRRAENLDIERPRDTNERQALETDQPPSDEPIDDVETGDAR